MSSSPVMRYPEPWPFALAAGLLAMITGSISFFLIARANPDALVVEDAYAAGLRYNEVLAERTAADRLGVEIALRADVSNANANLFVDLLDQDGAAVNAQNPSVRRERPSEGGYDADFALTRAGGGWSASVPLPRPGRWHLIVTAEVDGQPIRRSFAVTR